MLGNLFDVDNPSRGERFDELARMRNVVIERIASSSALEPKRYDQPQDEWVALLRGEAELEIHDERLTLRAGDYVLIEAHVPHTVLRASSDALWLAVHVS